MENAHRLRTESITTRTPRTRGCACTARGLRLGSSNTPRSRHGSVPWHTRKDVRTISEASRITPLRRMSAMSLTGEPALSSAYLEDLGITPVLVPDPEILFLLLANHHLAFIPYPWFHCPHSTLTPKNTRLRYCLANSIVKAMIFCTAFFLQLPVLLAAISYTLFSLVNQIHDDAQYFCQFSLVSRTRFCSTPARNTTVWAVLPRLLESQFRGLENVASESRANAEIVLDLTEARVASVDLVNVIRSSDLEGSLELGNLVQQFADDALTVSRDLQRLSAKIGTGFDQIISTNAHLYRLMRDSSTVFMPHQEKTCRRINTVLGIEEACEISYPDVPRAFERALQTYERVLRDLIFASSASLIKVSGLDADLVSIGAVLSDEKRDLRLAEQQLDSQLSTLLRLNGRQKAALAYNLRVLNRVGDYTERSLRFVRAVQTTLEGMQREVEELRLIASGALTSPAVDPEVVLEMLARGLERLSAVKVRPGLDGPGQREVETRSYPYHDFKEGAH